MRKFGGIRRHLAMLRYGGVYSIKLVPWLAAPLRMADFNEALLWHMRHGGRPAR